LRKVDGWLPGALAANVAERERRADLLLSLDDAVNQAVEKLKTKGLTSPYLKNFVVARVNPLRFIKGELPSYDGLLDTMTSRALKLDPAKVAAGDLARTGGAPEDE
jgi:ParB family chromosome partitioning protein